MPKCRCACTCRQRVGFMFGRPKIEHNDAMHAGGLEIAVVTPFERGIAYEGKVVVLDDPEQMTNPREAFRHPMVECRVRLDVRACLRCTAARRCMPTVPRSKPAPELLRQAVRAARVTGTIEVGDEAWEMNGLGATSPGPRYSSAVVVPLDADDLRRGSR